MGLAFLHKIRNVRAAGIRYPADGTKMLNERHSRRILYGVSLAGLLLSSCTADTAFNGVSADSVSRQGETSTQTESLRQVSTAELKPARDGSALTLEQAVHTAIAFHPSIDEAVGKIQQSTSEIEVARAGYYPKISGGINSGYETTDGGNWRPRVNVNASQMIYDFGKVSSSVEARTAGANVSRTELLLGVDTLARDTANAVIEIQRYQALMQVANAQLKGVKSIADLVRERSTSGASTRSDAVQADARVNAAQSTVLEISGQLDHWQTTLAGLIGRSGAVSVASGVPQWLSNTCSASEPDWSQSPTVLQAEARKAEALAQAKYAHAQGLPTLALEAGAGYDLNQSSRNTSASNEPEVTVGLNLSGSLYDGGATTAGRKAADHAVTAADAAIRNAKLSLSSSLTQARSQISSLQRMLASLSERESLLSETRDLYRHQYVELGTRTLLDLLNAEQELHQAGFDKANSTHDLRRLGVECLYNSGRSRELLGLRGVTIRGVML